MLPVPPIVTVAFVVLYALIGALLGTLSGWITARALRSGYRRKADGALGAAGFLLGVVILSLMPRHTNTISYELSGGTTVTSTMNRYQHPERVAALVAVILPLVYEIWRWWRRVGD